MAASGRGVLLQLTRTAFLLRLLAIVAALLTMMGRTLGPGALLAIVIIGCTGYVGLVRTDMMSLVQRHPAVALVDLILVGTVGIVSGSASLFNLAMLSTAVLIGLWVELLPAIIILVTLVALQVWQVLGAVRGLVFDSAGDPSQLVTMPFAYIALWYLGRVVRRALEDESAAARLMRASVVAAASAQERARVASELHDQVAKTIQGTALTASTLPGLIEKDPDKAKNVAEQTHLMATRAVADLRGVMTDLRSDSTQQHLGEALIGLVQEWENRHARRVTVTVAPDLAIDNAAIQYEVLSGVGELLDNVAAHAGPCQVGVSAVVVNDMLLVSVSDDGRGTTHEALAEARRNGHMGVEGVAGRMARVGGRMDIDTAPGQGMRVDLAVGLRQLVER